MSSVKDMPKPAQYRCNARPAHEWESNGINLQPFSLKVNGAGEITDLCPHCLLALLRKLTENVGRAEQVAP